MHAQVALVYLKYFFYMSGEYLDIYFVLKKNFVSEFKNFLLCK